MTEARSSLRNEREIKSDILNNRLKTYLKTRDPESHPLSYESQAMALSSALRVVRGEPELVRMLHQRNAYARITIHRLADLEKQYEKVKKDQSHEDPQVAEETRVAFLRRGLFVIGFQRGISFYQQFKDPSSKDISPQEEHAVITELPLVFFPDRTKASLQEARDYESAEQRIQPDQKPPPEKKSPATVFIIRKGLESLSARHAAVNPRWASLHNSVTAGIITEILTVTTMTDHQILAEMERIDARTDEIAEKYETRYGSIKDSYEQWKLAIEKFILYGESAEPSAVNHIKQDLALRRVFFSMESLDFPKKAEILSPTNTLIQDVTKILLNKEEPRKEINENGQ